MNISRRAALWLPPAITIAAKAPVFASSGQPDVNCTVKGTRKKQSYKVGKKKQTIYCYSITVGCNYPVRSVFVGKQRLDGHRGVYTYWSHQKLNVLTLNIILVTHHGDHLTTERVSFR